jgi:filamentous hemagglutinin family protein
MPVSDIVFRSRRPYRVHAACTPDHAAVKRGALSRKAMLAGTSMLVMALVTSTASARPLGGSAFFSAPNFASDAAQAASQQAAAIAKQSQNALMRATQAIQAMQAVQSAARNLAVSGPNSLGAGLPAVTNGLSAGGLIPDSGLAATGRSNPVSTTTWINASTPTQTTSNGQTTVTIQQTSQYALLSWQQFNIGKDTTLVFNQGGNSNYVALNRINDPSGVPSQILGSIKADGSVYLINQNGIIFGGSSQINVHTLIASSLNLSNTANFLNGKGILSDGTSTSFHSVDDSGNSYAAGDVTVQAGAQISAPGGDVLLLAPNVRNDGAISTPSGQALLLGGNDVLLNTGDSFIRGFVVSPNPAATNAVYTPPIVNPQQNLSQVPSFTASTAPGTVTNNGSISAPQGNITIVAGSVNQYGVLTSTTSTTANGSVIIQAQTGSLTLGGVSDNALYGQYAVNPQQSLIQIVPDLTDATLLTDTQAIANSSIALSGANIDIKGIVQLHGYDVTNTNDHPGGISILATGSNASTIGQVLLEDGSLLDASGTTDATASASRNSVSVELRSNELRDSPVVKAGPLYQQTILVDASASGTTADGTSWQGTPLADASAWIALTGRSLEERMMNGAPITIGGAMVGYGSTGSNSSIPGQLPANLVQAPGSIINISGGYLSYASGFVKVSTLITADGRLVSATNADPNVAYIGVCCSFTMDHARWGVTEIFTSALRSSGYEQSGYIQGGAGGSLNLAVQSAVLDGQLYAGVVSGVKQRTAASMPAAAALSIDSTNLGAWLSLTYGTAYSADNIFVSDAAATTAAGWVAGFDIATSDLGSILSANLPGNVSPNSVYLPTSWLNSGVANVSLAANSNIVLNPKAPPRPVPRLVPRTKLQGKPLDI